MNDIFASIFESIYFKNPFSGDLYREGVYGSIGLGDLLISFAFVVGFYYVINHPRFNQWFHWLIFLAINAVSTFVFTYVYTENILYSIGLGSTYSFEYIEFGFYSSLISCITFIIFSFGLRWWSTNCSTTPIPQ